MNVTLVTAASANHGATLIQFLHNLCHQFSSKSDTRVVVYDLGLTQSQLKRVDEIAQQFPTLFAFEKFDYSRYPKHLDINNNRGSYAWKPNIIYEVCEKHKGIVVWMDSGNLVHKELTSLKDQVLKEGLYTNESSGDIKLWTHPRTLDFFKGIETHKTNRNAACVGLNYDFPWVRDLLNEWVTASNQKDCIAPAGSSLQNHRYDQAILSILYYKYQDKYKFKDNYRVYNRKRHMNNEYSVHNDIDPEPQQCKQDVKDDAKEISKDLKAIKFWDYRSNTWSQNGEDGIIEHLLSGLKIKSGWVCEFGAADGRFCSNTFKLIETKSFSAVYIEADKRKCVELFKLVSKYPNIIALNRMISPEKNHIDCLDSILCTTPIPIEFDILSIDIDSCDYHVWKNLEKYKPKIVIIEINSSVPPTVEDFVHGNEGIEGSSYLPTVKLGLQKGYQLVCHTGNLIFIRNELASQLDLSKADPCTESICYFLGDWLSPHLKLEHQRRQQEL